ncbi:hypothetical protein Bbelb_349020 [Branchiostoma belcheri]|nr:hypothetical protein Bbelb_349020 [Branchiostoma belcheri]
MEQKATENATVQGCSSGRLPLWTSRTLSQEHLVLMEREEEQVLVGAQVWAFGQCDFECPSSDGEGRGKAAMWNRLDIPDRDKTCHSPDQPPTPQLLRGILETSADQTSKVNSSY